MVGIVFKAGKSMQELKGARELMGRSVLAVRVKEEELAVDKRQALAVAAM